MADTKSMMFKSNEKDHEFVGIVAERHGVTRQIVLWTLFQAGKRQYLAKLRAKRLISRLKEKYGESSNQAHSANDAH